jgi:hypothetical protein
MPFERRAFFLVLSCGWLIPSCIAMWSYQVVTEEKLGYSGGMNPLPHKSDAGQANPPFNKGARNLKESRSVSAWVTEFTMSSTSP